MIGLGFAVRANIAPDLQADIYDKIDLVNSASLLGEALGATFTGFALTLLFGSALMFVMRHFAGPIVERTSSVGLMFLSCLAAGIGLYWLSLADTPLLAFGAATVWGIGVCYMWPTMLSIVSERFTRGGAMAGLSSWLRCHLMRWRRWCAMHP
jgi:MFS family permease